MQLQYEIIPIENKDNLNFKPAKEQEFLHESIQEQILVCELDENQKIYSVFGFHFLLKNKDEGIKYDRYYAYFSTEELSDEDISKTLRGSRTLKLTEKNTYTNANDIKVIICERGFMWCNISQYDSTPRFYKTIILFLVALAYNRKSTQILNNVATSYKNKSHKEMIKARNEIYDFDLNCFFENPVKQDRHQQYNIWIIIEKNYHVINTHNEIESQVINLANVIETRNRHNMSIWLTALGLMITLLSLITSIASLISIFK